MQFVLYFILDMLDTPDFDFVRFYLNAVHFFEDRGIISLS